jgi:hypothetical protein
MERFLCCDGARQGTQAPCWGCPSFVLGVGSAHAPCWVLGVGSAQAPTIVKSQLCKHMVSSMEAFTHTPLGHLF